MITCVSCGELRPHNARQMCMLCYYYYWRENKEALTRYYCCNTNTCVGCGREISFRAENRCRECWNARLREKHAEKKSKRWKPDK